MRKLSKDQKKERDRIAEELKEKGQKLRDEVEKFNAVVEEAWESLGEAISAYNESIGEANEWRNDIASSIEEYVGERSEKWQESDAASAYESWVGVFQGEFSIVEIEKPEDIAIDEDEDPADEMEQIQEEVDG